jgi:opacity protein-like surface antigen
LNKVIYNIKVKINLLILICIALNTIVYGQQRKFDAFASIGSNISQIDGDQLAGFDKFGFNGGVGITYQLIKQSKASIEFLYSQRGASTSLFFNPTKDVKIDLDYVDIPILFTLNDWYIEDKNYHKVFAKTGFQYSRLMSNQTNFEDFEEALATISNFDVSYIIGAGYNFSKRIGIELRYNRSLRRIQEEIVNKIGGFKVYYWSFRLNYHI